MKTKEELEAEVEALQRQITGHKPVSAHLAERVKELKAAGIDHNKALECAAQQHAEAECQKEAAKCRHSAEREALLEIQVQAQALLTMVTNAIARGGTNS